jgi:hypothetical protein
MFARFSSCLSTIIIVVKCHFTLFLGKSVVIGTSISTIEQNEQVNKVQRNKRQKERFLLRLCCMHWQAEAIINYSTFSDNGFQGEMNAAVRTFLDLEALANDDLSTDGEENELDGVSYPTFYLFLKLILIMFNRSFY